MKKPRRGLKPLTCRKKKFPMTRNVEKRQLETYARLPRRPNRRVPRSVYVPITVEATATQYSSDVAACDVYRANTCACDDGKICDVHTGNASSLSPRFYYFFLLLFSCYTYRRTRQGRISSLGGSRGDGDERYTCRSLLIIQ